MNQIIEFKVNYKLLFCLIAGFILATIVGTLSHELGHWVTAKMLGYNADFNYMSMWFEDSAKEITTNARMWVILGGPIQTILTGTFGLLWLLVFQKNYRNSEWLTFWQWIPIFLSLFWLRQVANFVSWILSFLINGQLKLRGDEKMLGRYFDITGEIILSSTAFAGLIISLFVIFKFIPSGQRFTFIISGFTGGILGFILWFNLLGPVILP